MAWAFLEGGGELGGLIAALDWTRTSIGAIDAWPQGLRSTVSLMLRSAVPIVTLWHDDGVMIYNDAYSAFAGGRHPALLGSKVREGWPEVADFNDTVMREVLAGRTLAYRDQELTLLRTGQAEQVWMNLDYSPLLDENGAPCGVMAIVVETTAKIRAEQALRASEEQFRTFAQAMPNQVWAAQPDGSLDWLNQRVLDYSGMPLEALIGVGWVSMVHPDDVAGAARRWRHSLETGETYETEFRLRNVDGRYRWHIARALPIRDADGGIGRWIGTNTDIEEQKATGEALALLNRTLEQRVAERTADRDRMWRLSTDLMMVASTDGRIVAVNPAWTTLLGWRDADTEGRAFIEFVHPDDRAVTLAELSQVATGAMTFKFENRYRRSDGRFSLLSWTAVPDGELIYAVARDVTADRAAAEALKSTEAALQQAQKMESIGQLTGGIAHDFNNLLQVITGNLQLISRYATGDAKVQERVSSAEAAVRRGAKLSSHLLAFGRRQALEPKVINVGRFVAGMEDMLRRSLGDAVEIETVVSGGLWNTFADPSQVENALLNLAINARDAMNEAGKLTIEVGNAVLDDAYARQHPDVVAGQYVALAVTDTGTGMPAEVIAKAFDPFFSTKPEGKGSGLGLSMVYGFVRQSGGHVKIYSEVGHGTTVRMYLPRSREREEAAALPDLSPVEGGNETVLVTEDDAAVRATVVEMLTDLGYRVLTAQDAASALAIVESGVQIDLLFTDVVMPGPLRSPELARKARERQPKIAVLFTSGYTENAIVHGGRLDAGVDLLGKPYAREALARKVRHVLANQALRNWAVASRDAAPPTRSSDGAAALTVMLVEDDDVIRSSVAEQLRDLGHVVVAADSAEQAMALLEDHAIDVLVTDVGLPGLSGTELARRARTIVPTVGIVIATGADPSHDAPPEAAVVLRKPFGLADIDRAIRDARAGR